MGHFGPKIAHPHNSGSAVRIFFKILPNEKGQQVDESNNNLYDKILLRTNWGILDPKGAHPHNSGLALRIFFKFCRMKGANRLMKMISIFFKKKLFAANEPFWAQNLWIPCKNFLKILHNEKGQQVYESNNNGLYQKKIALDKWSILGPKMTHPYNFGSALRIFLKFCRMNGANRYMKVLLVVFQKNSFGAI